MMLICFQGCSTKWTCSWHHSIHSLCLVGEKASFSDLIDETTTDKNLFSYVTYSILFEEVYGFSPYQVGMVFAPLFIGGIVAVPVIGVFDRLTYQKARAEAIRSGSEVHPEKRLYPAMLSVILLPISLFVCILFLSHFYSKTNVLSP